MNLIILACIIGFTLGAAGYIIVRYWLIPIGRYQRVKQEIADLIRRHEPALAGGNPVFHLTPDQSESCRKHSVALTNAYYDDLPHWYRMVLANRKESPDDAAKSLSALSTIRNPDHALKRIRSIRSSLNIS